MESAKEIFQNSEIKLTSKGKRHLGALLGNRGFRETYAKEKVQTAECMLHTLHYVMESYTYSHTF